MVRGKYICKTLKDIRRQIAEANDIEFATSECRYEGECTGTCPKCEAELRYLEEQLRSRRMAGKLVRVAGISAGAIALISPFAANSQETIAIPTCDIAEEVSDDIVLVKGVVYDGDSSQSDPMMGVTIVNQRYHLAAISDINGKFQIEAYIGDRLQFSYVGYITDTITVTDANPVRVFLRASELLLEEPVMATIGAIVYHKYEHMLEIRVVGEDDKPLDFSNIVFQRVWIDEDGDEDYTFISADEDEENGVFRIFWNENSDFRDEEDKIIREATLRITADGYEKPVIINVEYPESNIRKTVKFEGRRAE